MIFDDKSREGFCCRCHICSPKKATKEIIIPKGARNIKQHFCQYGDKEDTQTLTNTTFKITYDIEE